MPGQDNDRRRLRDLYDRNRRRVQAVADARDRRGNDGGRRTGDAAPRRFIVSERRTRNEGFGGQGGIRTRFSRKSNDDRRPRRFEDKKIFRSSNRDRFTRDEDRDRDRRRRPVRRDGGRRDDRDGGRQAGNGRRFGRGGRQNNTRRPARSDDLDAQLESYKSGKSNDNKGGRRGGRGGRGADNLDAQLDKYNGKDGTRGGRGDAGGRRGGRGRGSATTFADLDAQLDAFQNQTAQASV